LTSQIKAAANPLREIFGIPEGQGLSEADTAALRAESPALPYVILFTARSGSTFLTHELYNTNKFGNPHEWFNPDTVRDVSRRRDAKNIMSYFSTVWKLNTSSNGVFGIEINWYQMSNIIDILNIQHCFRNQIVWFFLRRRNIVSQAISLFIADFTKIFHSYQIDREINPPHEPEYDANKIKNNILMFLNEEISSVDYFRNNCIYPIQLFYEDMVQDSKGTLGTFCNTLRVDRSVVSNEFPNPIKKIGNQLNQNFEERFRHEEAIFLGEIGPQRPLLTHELSVI